MALHHTKRQKLRHGLDDDAREDEVDLNQDSFSKPASSSVSSHSKPASRQSERIVATGERLSSVRPRSLTDQSLLTGSSYKSSLLKIQLDELLAEISTDHEECLTNIKSTIQQVRSLIKHIAPRGALPVREAERGLRKSSGVEIPFPEPRPGKDTRYQFSFVPPTTVEVIEELSHIKSREAGMIDLVVTMPEELFQEKDYLNYRYFHKRAYYIACIADGIEAAAEGRFRLSYSSLDGVQLQPTLIVEALDAPAKTATKPCCLLQISTTVSDNVFPARRLLPFANCVRSNTLDSTDCEGRHPPTPFYNGILRSEAASSRHRRLLRETSALCESFQDFCLLGQVWLRQRGFGSSVQSGGFGLWEWALTCALFIESYGGGRSTLTRYTSYQLFKTMLQFIATRDLITPLVLNEPVVQIPKSANPVLYDSKTNINVLFKMQPWSYNLLKLEAVVTVKALNERQQDHFNAIFIAKVGEPALRYDNLLTADLSHLRENNASQIADLDGLQKIYEVLTRGLGDRANLVNLSFSESLRYPLSKKRKANLRASNLVMGIILSPLNAERLVDRGPSAEEKEGIADFREFWGDRTELRRFKDGSISESLVWSTKSDDHIVDQIIKLLLERHFQIDAQTVDLGLKAAQALLLGDLNISSGNDIFQRLDNAFQSLSTQINQLDGLPLSIRSIVAADPALRYALLREPSGTAPLKIGIILQFEGSARWPDNLLAIQRTKIAFLVKLGELLEPAAHNNVARVGLENQSKPFQNQAFLDVIHADVSFRLRVHHDREELLLSRDLRSKDLSSLNREATSEALLAYKRTFVYGPTHTQSLRALCTRHAALAPAIRLLKKWLSSHLLTPFFPSPLVELLATVPFVKPYPWTTPSSPITAFLRALTLLSKWAWPLEPLIIDLSSSLTPQDIQTIHTNFTAWRKLDPDMHTVCFFVASSIDHSGVVWTQHANPPKVIAARLLSLASAAVEIVRSSGLDLDIGRLFKSPMEDYDFLIHLQPQFTSEASTKADKEKGHPYKNLRTVSSAHGPSQILELFITDAKRILGEHALLFHGEDGESMIAGLWNPRSLMRRPWRIRMGFSAKVIGEKEEVAINTESMLAEVGLVGEEIVKRIEILDKKDR